MELQLDFIDVETLDKTTKATVHKTGKLGFTSDAARKLDLDTNTSMQFAVNKEDASDSNFYVIIHKNVQKGALKVNKAGQYFYLNAKNLFDTYKIDYKKESVVFDITPDTINDRLVYVFKRRSKKKENLPY